MAELKVYEINDIPALDPNSESATAWRENNEGQSIRESDLIRVRTPGDGETLWSITTPAGTETTDTIEGVLVYKAFKGAVWASQEPAQGQKPMIVSNDLKTAVLNPQLNVAMIPPPAIEEFNRCVIPGQPGIADWSKLAWTQWGTGASGNGKWANEQQLLFILRDGDFMPLLVQVNAASMNDIRKFFLQAKTVPYFMMRVALQLKADVSKPAPNGTGGNVEYSKVVMRLTGVLSAAAGRLICTQYRDGLREQHEAGLVNIQQ